MLRKTTWLSSSEEQIAKVTWGARLHETLNLLIMLFPVKGKMLLLMSVRPYLEQSDAHSFPSRYIVGPMVEDMDELPLPNFNDYFNAVNGTEIGTRANLTVESSRGCWWGMKSHCTFCGLNGQTMDFRSKSPSRFLAELKELSEHYGKNYFMVADNILDMKYINSVLPELAATNSCIRLFYEVKANLRKDQIELLAAGGIVRLQPGIESLSTPILKLMGKGTSRLQNIQLLKWCREFKIDVAWNLLFGFPGEDPNEYEGIAGVIPNIVHLQAPAGSGQYASIGLVHIGDHPAHLALIAYTTTGPTISRIMVYQREKEQI